MIFFDGGLETGSIWMNLVRQLRALREYAKLIGESKNIFGAAHTKLKPHFYKGKTVPGCLEQQ